MSHPWTCLEQVRRAAHTFQLTGFRDAMLQLIMTGTVFRLIMTGIQLIMTGIQLIYDSYSAHHDRYSGSL